MTATVSPAGAANKAVSWRSSNTAVATVSNGTVNAVAAGTAVITVTTADGGKTASCMVQVNETNAIDVVDETTGIIKGDLLNTGKPSINDFAIMAGYLRGARVLDGRQHIAGDFNADGSVDIRDFALFARMLRGM